MKPISKLNLFLLLLTSATACSKSTLVGADVNHNGIRDDLEVYIQKRYPESEAKRAFISQVVKEYENAFQFLDDPKAIMPILAQNQQTAACWDLVFKDDSVEEERTILAEMMNTRERSEAVMKVQSLLFGHYHFYDPLIQNERRKECVIYTSKMDK